MADLTSRLLFGKSLAEMTEEELKQQIMIIRSSRRDTVTGRSKAKAKVNANTAVKKASKDELLELLSILEEDGDE